MQNNTGKQQQKQETFQMPDCDDDLYATINKGELSSVSVGKSYLEHLNIQEGDFAFYQPAKEINENQLTIWNIENAEFLKVGFAYDNFGDIVIHTGKDDFRHYKKSEVKLIGVIVGILKPYDAQNLSNLTIKEADEITAVCDTCRKELTGTPEFIKREGWELKENQTLCLNCDLFGGGK